MKGRILIVDDEPAVQRIMADLMKREGLAVATASSAAEALERTEREPYDLVLSDFKLGGPTGLDLLRELRVRGDDVPVIVITAFGSIPLAVEAVKAGAADFITKPVDAAELKAAVEKAMRTAAAPSDDAASLIGDDARIGEIRRLIDRVAPSDATVLVTGETGTGKDVAARLLHQKSKRADKPFLRVACAALPESLLESELFGHERGAFTGAAAAKPGKFELAHGGTIFLDEIGELPASVQAKFLHALERKEVERVGGLHPIRVDVRVVAATNRDLEDEAARGTFRADLYHRLNVVTIEMPPLRDRAADAPTLVEQFLKEHAKRAGRRAPRLDDGAKAALRGYAWPGNVREAAHLAERLILLLEGDQVTAEALGPHLAGGGDVPASLKEARAKAEAARIRAALEEAKGNRTHAAKALGVSRRALLYKMNDYGIE